MGLEVFLVGPKVSFRSNIRARRQNTLLDAYKYCIKEQNIYRTKRNIPAYDKNNTKLQNTPSTSYEFQGNFQSPKQFITK